MPLNLEETLFREDPVHLLPLAVFPYSSSICLQCQSDFDENHQAVFPETLGYLRALLPLSFQSPWPG